ncbi:hypothetical protein K440DRAFT_663582 [Wilcoxina mikolae CBS 423.85]|nr:hypothetical protein K440DRAFT_663582 [Wilcoxina mikolae CBS 423.85]
MYNKSAFVVLNPTIPKGVTSVFYQGKNGTIKESCYDPTNGWYGKKNYVADDAKLGTPIAVSCSRNVNNGNLQVQRNVASNSEDEPWNKSQLVTIPGSPFVETAPKSQLAAARTEDTANMILLIYQNTDTWIMQLKSPKGGASGLWQKGEVTSGAVKMGTGLSLQTGENQARLFYQDTPKNILRDLYSTPGSLWTSGTLASANIVAEANAPISAVVWDYQPGGIVKNIRVYSVATTGNLIQAVYNTDDQNTWQNPSTSTTAMTGTGVAAVMMPEGIEPNQFINVYYQPDKNIIAECKFQLAEASGYSDARIPLGIPTAL